MIFDEINELDKYFNDLIFTICDGKAAEMNELKKFDIMDFFDYVESKSKKNG